MTTMPDLHANSNSACCDAPEALQHTDTLRPSGSLRRASLHTLGCRLNQSETAILTDKLREDGYGIVPFGAPADLCIINTCTVTREADAKSRKMVRQFLRKNPSAYVAVIGCYAQMGAKTLAAIEGVDLIIGSQEKMNVLDYVKSGKNEHPLIVRDSILRDDFTLVFPDHSSAINHRPNLKIQDGCDFMCSFCVIPFARGRARSREMQNLREEAANLVAKGAKELVLTGVNVGCYAWQGKDIVDVVDTLQELDGLARIRISSIEPTTIPEGLLTRMADPDHKLAPYLHIPLQSGADNTLEAMRRRYSRQDFLNFIHHVHDAVPGVGIGTDIMVGFPGESEADFEESYQLLQESPLFYAHVFKYSERDGTASARRSDPVPPAQINERSARLLRCSAMKTRMFQEHHLGKRMSVLFERAQDGYWGGYTDNYLRVLTTSNEDLENQIRSVRLTRLQGDLLYGELA